MCKYICIFILFVVMVGPGLAEEVNTSIALKYELAETEEETEVRYMVDLFWQKGKWSYGLELFHNQESNFFSARPTLTYLWEKVSLTAGTCADSLGGQNVSLGGAWFGARGEFSYYASAAYYWALNDEAIDFLDLYLTGQYVLSSKWALGLELIDDYYPDSEDHSFYLRPFTEYSLTRNTAIRVTPYHNWQPEDKEETGLRIQLNLKF